VRGVFWNENEIAFGDFLLRASVNRRAREISWVRARLINERSARDDRAGTIDDIHQFRLFLVNGGEANGSAILEVRHVRGELDDAFDDDGLAILPLALGL